MSRLTRPEREARIERDDGDPDARVVATRGLKGSIPSYHDDPECWQIKPTTDTHPLSRRKAQLSKKAPCAICVLDEREQSADYGAECPFCEADVSRLSDHLPCDGSAGAAEVEGV